MDGTIKKDNGGSAWVSLPATGESGNGVDVDPSQFPRIQAEHDAAWSFKRTHALCVTDVGAGTK